MRFPLTNGPAATLVCFAAMGLLSCGRSTFSGVQSTNAAGTQSGTAAATTVPPQASPPGPDTSIGTRSAVVGSGLPGAAPASGTVPTAPASCANPLASYPPAFAATVRQIGSGTLRYGLGATKVNGRDPASGFTETPTFVVKKADDLAKISIVVEQSGAFDSMTGRQIGLDIEDIRSGRRLISKPVRVSLTGAAQLSAELTVSDSGAIPAALQVAGPDGKMYFRYIVQLVGYYDDHDLCGFIETHAVLMFEE